MPGAAHFVALAERVFARPGTEWNADEREAVLVWLYENADRLRLSTLYRLGGNARLDFLEQAFEELLDKDEEGLVRNFQPGEGPFFGYVVAALVNRYKKVWKRRRHERSLDAEREAAGDCTAAPSELADPLPGPHTRVERRELRAALEDCVAGLTPALRDVMDCALEERTREEILKMLGIEVGALRVRLHRAHNALRDCLAAKGIGL